METALDNIIAPSPVIKTQPKNEESENFKIECITQQNDTFMHCKNCALLTFNSNYFANHNCNVELEKILCPGYFLCKNSFTHIESLKIHLQFDHNVNEIELEKFLLNVQPSSNKNQNEQIVDYQTFKKTDNESSSTKSKSKIFIKDVTLLRKPDLPLTHNLPNIFDSLDLTNEEDIFDDFLATDNDPDDFDFDFEEPTTINNEHDDEIIAVPNSEITPSGKIFVRKNLCTDTMDVKSQNKIFVRSHESLTNQMITTDIVQQSPLTSDCVIVSSENINETPTPNKIFIRNIETLTNHPQTQEKFFDSNVTNTNSNTNYLNHVNSNFVGTFSPTIYVRSYDSLTNETNSNNDNTQQRCKISIKNMDTLIEPSHHQTRLMHPPSGISFGHPQNLVIHMRPNQNVDENLIDFRDTSVTPETLPGSSNVSTCGGNDNDVIILDELNENSFANFSNEAESQVNSEHLACNSSVEVDKESMSEKIDLIETNVEIENPDQNRISPNDKSKIDISVHNEVENLEDQPMTRIPLNMTTDSNSKEDIFKDLDAPKKKMKIVKIVRVKKKKTSLVNVRDEQIDSLTTVQVIFKCNLVDCSLSFSNPKLLNYHKRCHLNDSTQIICPECKSLDFKNYNSLHTHLWRQHSIDMDLFSCKLCNFKTPILSRLKNFHEKIHSEEKNYICEFTNCNKKFCNSKQLKNHSKIHQTLKTKKKSINVNSDTKKIRCIQCNKGFASESGLYIHFMEHKNDEKKRFVCEEKSCQYSTNDHNSFRRHKFQHTKTHQYSCPACDYKSIQSNVYRKHLEKQHKDIADELLYRCGSCKFITISKSKYEGHVSKHLLDT
ncbi:hypothetical protein PVAND_006738 [Polypedilum vanderplanki]|uniref:C2H2-type domain-containing protein n=1 Tax=Polypedilum vanderplanki TaxID=319348 RepID=A0A9J6C4L3_POLVA|nr:hypothetical protein PVAND_006738 [Polypedilum vanderplanki]